MLRTVIMLGLTLLALTLATTQAVAQSQDYDFKDPKGVNSIVFTLDSDVEPINGVADGITGKIAFDPKKPKKTQGTIQVDAASVRTPNKRMTGVLHGADWLDVKKHTGISFEILKVKKSKVDKTRENSWVLDVVGKFTCHGVTKELPATVQVSHLVDKRGARNHGGKGDLLVLRVKLKIKRSDYNIGPSMPAVANKITVRLAIVGFSSKD